jgi:hypothetical protein
MKDFVWFILVLFLLAGCKKSTEEIPTILFEGFTYRDVNGNLISEDTTDWRWDDSWTQFEHSLFNDIQKPLCPIEEAPQWVLRAYPNPITTDYMNIGLLDNNRFSYRLVDKNFNVLRAYDSIYANVLQFNFENLDGCEFRGHGDIVFKRER